MHRPQRVGQRKPRLAQQPAVERNGPRQLRPGSRHDVKSAERRLEVGKVEIDGGGTCAGRRTASFQAAADDRLRRHRGNEGSRVPLRDEMPRPLRSLSVRGHALDRHEHAAAVLAPPHMIGHAMHQGRKNGERCEQPESHQQCQQAQSMMQDGRDRGRTRPHRPQRRPQLRQDIQIRRIDECETPRRERQPAGRRDRVAPRVDHRVADAAVAEHDGPAGVAGDGPHDVEPDAGIGRRRDARAHRVEPRHVLRQPPQDSGAERRKAARARQHEHAAGFCFGIELRDATDEIGSVREIEIAGAAGKRRADHAIAIAIHLERTGGVDDQVRLERGKLRLHVAIPIEGKRDEIGAAGDARAEPRGTRVRAAGDEEGQARLVREQADEASAEGPIAAEDEDFHSLGHARKRSS